MTDLSWKNNKCEFGVLESNSCKFLYASNLIGNLSSPEITVHGKFGPIRLSGEWFDFTSTERVPAIAAARELASQTLANEGFILNAEELKSVTSAGEVLIPSNKLELNHRSCSRHMIERNRRFLSAI